MNRNLYLEKITLEEAHSHLLSYLQEVGALAAGEPELLPPAQAVGRITATAVEAVISNPHYPASAMDGIAVRAADTFGASETSPRRLTIPEQAVVVDTGDPLPEQFDAVVMIEEVNFPASNLAEIISPVAPWQHVRPIGEDMVRSEIILPACHRIRPVDIGALLAAGVSQVPVLARPRVAVIPTGTEIVPPTEQPRAGDIIDSNSYVFRTLVGEWGGEALPWPIIPDNYDLLKKSVLEAVAAADIVVIIAGSSAGREDFTAAVVAELGRLLVHGVAIKPGKPVILGEVNHKPVVGIPGYPVSAYLTFNLFVRPLVYAKQGLPEPVLPACRAVLARKTVSSLGVDEFIRVKLGEVGSKLVAVPIARGAGITTSLVRADGVIRIPRNSEGLHAGYEVEVELWRDLAAIQSTLVVTGSHDLLIDLLGSFLQQGYPGGYLSSAHVGSLGGLQALARNEAHAAGIHLLEEDTGNYNIAYVRKYLPNRPAVLINVAQRAQGLMVAPGNPLNIMHLADLARPGIRLVNRQRGSGTRILLDWELRRQGINPATLSGYNSEQYSHLGVAAAVGGGMADAGVGILAAARALHLDFIPLVWEKYDLCVPAEYLDHPAIQAIREILSGHLFQAAVERIGGYDLQQTGEMVRINQD